MNVDEEQGKFLLQRPLVSNISTNCIIFLYYCKYLGHKISSHSIELNLEYVYVKKFENDIYSAVC